MNNLKFKDELLYYKCPEKDPNDFFYCCKIKEEPDVCSMPKRPCSLAIPVYKNEIRKSIKQ